ncbi:Pvc16 family protein [Sphingopyxis sp.]|uniref:Pvc16 family protein n=1 Tax=Sphingopyxis sp. TaxID=1908224 RepID=UPI003D113FA7
MADHQGFAIVTAALHALTEAAVAAILPGTAVQIGPPRAAGAGAASDPAVTLTLYHLAANAAWRNTDQPARDPGGERLASMRLLGALAAAFADHALLTRAMLAAVCAADGGYPELAAPGRVTPLPAEPVRLTPHYPTPTDAAALWSGLFAIPHQPSLHLIASPVLIAAADPPSP